MTLQVKEQTSNMKEEFGKQNKKIETLEMKIDEFCKHENFSRDYNSMKSSKSLKSKTDPRNSSKALKPKQKLISKSKQSQKSEKFNLKINLRHRK